MSCLHLDATFFFIPREAMANFILSLFAGEMIEMNVIRKRFLWQAVFLGRMSA